MLKILLLLSIASLVLSVILARRYLRNWPRTD